MFEPSIPIRIFYKKPWEPMPKGIAAKEWYTKY